MDKAPITDHSVKTPRDSAREESYTKGSKEPFGLNKRTRRLERGDKDVTRPDGTPILGGK